MSELTASEAFTQFFRNYMRRGLHLDPETVAMPVTYLRELYAPALTYQNIANPLLAYLSAGDIVSPTRWTLPMRQCRMLHVSLMPEANDPTMDASYRFFTADYFNAFEGIDAGDSRFTFRDRFIAASQTQTALDEWSELAIGLGVLDHVLNNTLTVNLDNLIPEEHQEWLDRLGRLMQLIRENFSD